MLTTAIFCVSASAFIAPPVASEAAIDHQERAFCTIVTRDEAHAWTWYFGDGEPLKMSGGYFQDRVGPVMWGIVEHDVYFARVIRPMNGWQWPAKGFRIPIDADIRRSRSALESRFDEDASAEIQERLVETHRQISPVENIIDAHGQANYEGGPDDFTEWVLFCDVIFLEGDDLSVFAIYDGHLYHWTNNRPEEETWVERAKVETNIDTPFRIQRAGDDIYLIDEKGDVYSTPAPPKNRHERIGRISGWGGVLHGEELIILEDHARDKIGLFKVPVEGNVIPLIFAGHADAMEDFHDAVPTPELEAKLHEMAVVIRENRKPLK